VDRSGAFAAALLEAVGIGVHFQDVDVVGDAASRAPARRPRATIAFALRSQASVSSYLGLNPNLRLATAPPKTPCGSLKRQTT
jgi:hypothetical protein